MSLFRSCGGSLVWLAVINLCLPWQAAYAEQAEASGLSLLAAATPTGSADVALHDDGMLHGQLVNPSGQPLADVKVGLIDSLEGMQVAKTNNEGRFAFQGIRGGAYRLLAADAVLLVRVWAPGTAPPAAEEAALLVAQQPIIRGQQACGCGDTVGCADCVGPGQTYGGRPVLRWMRNNPGIVVAGIAAAIAIPVAIAAADDDDPAPGS